MSAIALVFLTTLLSLSDAAPYFHSPSPLHTRDALSECQDLLNNGFNATCWDTLGMQDWMQSWNITTEAAKKCNSGELWANCFMRLTGVPGIDGLGCSQVGPNTCPEPKENVLLSVSVETAYGAYSIWSLQNLMTSIYDDLQSPAGLANIESFYSNISAPVTGKSLLAKILVSSNDTSTQELGILVSTPIPIPGTEVSIPEVGEAEKNICSVLASYLTSFMTNFTLGGFDGMAKNGNLI